MSNYPIFIVGMPRSGTTLLATMLSAHSHLDCGPETHFFCHLTKRIERSLQKKKNWPDAGVKYLCSLKTELYVYEAFGLSKKDIYSFLINHKPSITITLEALTLQHALKYNKSRWIEKTPNHLLFLHKINKYYPKSFIIHIYRDFRDSALSMSKMPWASRSIIANIIKLNEWYYLSEDYISRALNLYSVCYEKLIFDPEYYLHNICNHIGEEFEKSMITNRENIFHIYSKKEWWKKAVNNPLDKKRCFVWKREMSPDIRSLVTYLGLSMLEKYNYDIDIPKPKETILLFPLTTSFIEDNEHLFKDAFKNKIRLIGCSRLNSLIPAINYEMPTKIIFLYPLNITTFGPSFSSLDRFLNVLKFLMTLKYIRKMGIPMFYLSEKPINVMSLGKADRIINFSIKRLAKKVSYYF